MSNKYFISGTDTAVGKTLLTTALIKAAQAAGKTAIGLKPVAAGCEFEDGTWKNDDAIQLQAVGSTALSYEQINPVALQEFMAPHIAAAHEGKNIDAVTLCRHVDGLPTVDLTFIEGAGGWLVPLNDSETMADIAVGLHTKVILVVGLRLGCINHTLLSIASIEQAGLQVAGWIANTIDPQMAALEENIKTLEQRIKAPLLGLIPFMHNPAAEAAAESLNIEPLI